MTPAERERNVEAFRAAAKTAPKSTVKKKVSSTSKPKAKAKPAPKTKLKVDGSVKAKKRATKYELDVKAKDMKDAQNKKQAKKNFFYGSGEAEKERGRKRFFGK